MTFLNLKPVLDKEEQEAINHIERKPYNEVYQDSLEEELFSAAKAKRKASSMPKATLNEEKEDTYKNLVVNKYKEGSAASFA